MTKSTGLSACLVAALHLLAVVAPAPAAAPLDSLIGAQSIEIIDGRSGRLLNAKQPNTQREVASLQKLLSALVVVKAGNLSKQVQITAQDADCSPVKLPNSVGGTYTRMELLQAMLVKSANDAARALARDIAGSEAAFGQKMTALAHSLGAVNSSFKNSSGLPAPGQYSTAHDMGIIARAAYADPLIRQTVRTKFLPWRDARGKSTTLRNSNRLLHRHPNCTGMKVGYTGTAGHCAVLSWEENNRTIIGVILAGKDEMFWIQAGLVLKLYSAGLL